MGAIDKTSVRQRILRLGLNETATFPVERSDYVRSMAHRIARQFKRGFTCPTTENRVRVTRTQ